MRELEVAMALLIDVDQYHLQIRTGSRRKGAIGLVGCFGGQVENDEEPRDTIARELGEETNLVLPPGDFNYLDTVYAKSRRNFRRVKIEARVFQVLLPHGTEVIAKEGELVTWRREDIRRHEDDLTPATKEFFREYL